MSQNILYCWVGGFVVLGLLCLLLKDKAKQIAGNVLLVYATGFVVFTVSYQVSPDSARSKNAPAVDADRLELVLRLDAALAQIYKQGGPGATKFETPGKQAEDMLEKSSSKDPTSATLAAKLVIVRGEFGESTDVGLARLSKIDSDVAKQYNEFLPALYGGKRNMLSAEESARFSALIKERLPEGWYRDATMLRLYAKSGQNKLYQEYKQAYDDRNVSLAMRFIALVVFAILIGLAGVVVILAQFFFLPRDITSEAERAEIAAPADFGIKTIYSVFIAWLTTWLLVSLLALPAVKAINLQKAGVLVTSVVLAVTYLVSNGPGLLYVYLIAFKPHGIKFLEGIKLKTRSGKLGPGRLVMAGVLTWFAGVPVVVIASLISMKLFGSEGSSNPIIALVMEAARSSNLPATVIFYLTLGVLAPLCEESLFRGFLYTTLRRRMGVLASMSISAMCFAAVHLDPGGALQLFCLGFLFAFLFERTKSLLPSMVAHGLWNSGTFTLVLLLFGS